MGYKISTAALGQGPQRPERGSRSVGQPEAGLRSRGRDRSLRVGRSTGTLPRVSLRYSRPSSRPSAKATALPSRSATRRRPTRCSPTFDDQLDGELRHDEGTQEGGGASLHHEQAAGGVTVPGEEDYDDCPAALRRYRAAGRRVIGLITYMRTDSTGLRTGAHRSGQFIGEAFGPDYVPEKPIFYKTKKDAQTRTKPSGRHRRRRNSGLKACAPT